MEFLQFHIEHTHTHNIYLIFYYKQKYNKTIFINHNLKNKKQTKKTKKDICQKNKNTTDEEKQKTTEAEDKN